MKPLFPFVLLATLAACTAERAPAASDAVATSASTAAAADKPAPAAPAAPAATTATPASDGELGMATFAGYGDLKFGIAATDMEKAWGGALKEVGKDFNADCYFMTPAWVKTPAEFNFMVSEGKFARVGTDSAKFAAPGGGKVGMTRAQLVALYPCFEAEPHKYTDGEYLRIADPAGGQGVLVFEVDGTGDEARATTWRIGLPPQVDYVEGCS